MFKKIFSFFVILSLSSTAFALQTENLKLSRTSYGESTNSLQIASNDKGYVYAVWRDDRVSDGIYFNYSADYGSTWQEMDIPIIHTDWEYQGGLLIDCDDNGNVYAIWKGTHPTEGGGAVFAASSDHGQTWDTTTITGQPLNEMDFSADSNGNICLVSNEGSSFPKNIFANCSHDYGQTWQAEPSYVNTYIPPDPGSTIQRNVTITNDDNGNFYVAWADNRNTGYGGEIGIFFNSSNDYGETWGTDKEVGRTGFAYFASNPNLACNEKGNIYLTYGLFDGQAHMTYVGFNKSSDYGENWGNSGKLITDGTASQVAVDENGGAYIAWVDESATYKKLHFIYSADGGNTWTDSVQVSNSHDVEEGHFALQVNAPLVSIAWENNEPWQGIYMNYSEDNGNTWQAEDIKVDNYETGMPTDLPVIAGTKFGDVYIAWQDGREGSLNPFFNFEKHNELAKIYQDFELFNGTSSNYGWGIGAAAQLSDVEVHSGETALEMVSTQTLGGVGVASRDEHWQMDFHPEYNNRLNLWVYADPSTGTDNTVAVKFFDHDNYVYDPDHDKDGFTAWTTYPAKANEWTPLTISFDQLPDNLDLNHIDKVEIYQYWSGTYYFDDMQVASQDKVYNGFEYCVEENPLGCGWPWDGDVNVDTDTVFEGTKSWKFTTAADTLWASTGIVFQGRTLTDSGESEWHVNFHPEFNNHLSFWVYAQADTDMDASLAVQFFDFNDAGVEDQEPVVIWDHETVARNGKWSKISVPFSSVLAEFERTLDKHPGNTEFDLENINKIQVQFYWPGTYYIDDIRLVRPTTQFDKDSLNDYTISWSPVKGADLYHVQASSQGPDGPWQTVYKGNDTQFSYKRLNDRYLRIRTEAGGMDKRPFLYASGWSDASLATPPPVLLDTRELAQNRLDWTDRGAMVDSYLVQASNYRAGPWLTLYEGPYQQGIAAEPGIFYRIRGQILNDQDQVMEVSRWSPAYTYNAGSGFIQADSTTLRFNEAVGPQVNLRGVNLGSAFLIEPWMTGIGDQDDPKLPDDWSILQTLTQRFGQEQADALLSAFQDAYLNEDDFDLLYDLGVNFVRLPVYYRNFINEDGTWKSDPFAKLDEIIALCADRGIYVLIDMHGAPGCQNEEFHCGREDFNQLLNPADSSDIYRDQTVALWRAIAVHYADNPTVMGYDLLNEPEGFKAHYDNIDDGREALWAFYDVLYDMIRSVDANHIIVMEAVWDWDALPNPDRFNWQNIVYQFHYYLFEYDQDGEIIGSIEDFDEHKTFIDAKVAATRLKQEEYHVPVMIGEFNAFNHAKVWDYYLKTFSEENWSWTLWSFKTKDTPSAWGLFQHSAYDEDDPVIATDSYDDLLRKFGKYTTQGYHVENYSLNKLLRYYFLGSSLTNLPPTLMVPDDMYVDEGEPVNAQIVAVDPEQENVTLSAQLENGDPLSSIGAAFVDNGNGTGNFTWQATFDYGNPIRVVFTAIDLSGMSSQETLTVAVNQITDMTFPPANSTLNTTTITFQWSEGTQVTEYQLGVGTSIDSLSFPPWGDIDYQERGLNTFATVENIPLDGNPIYVRLWMKIDGVWEHRTFTYQTEDRTDTRAEIVSPLTTETLSTSEVTFQWTSVDGAGGYQIGVGTSLQSVSAKPWGNIDFQDTGMTTSATVEAIPLNGEPLYVRLWTNMGGTWQYNDYTYQTENVPVEPAHLGLPLEEYPLESPDVLFAWPEVAGASHYQLGIGTTPESLSASPWGDVTFIDCELQTQVIAQNLPMDGNPLYVRLWTLISGQWYYEDYTFQTIAIPVQEAEITFPDPGSTLSSSEVTFSWIPGDGVTAYEIGVGTTQASLTTSPWGNVGYKSVGLNTSATFTNIPLTGNPVYVRLWTKIGGVWSYRDYTYQTEYVPPQEAEITNPVPDSILSTREITFSWQTGEGVTAYEIGVGTTQTSLARWPYGDIGFKSVALNTSATFTNIPLTGNPLYVRLWTKIGGVWSYKDYTYQTENQMQEAEITIPAPGSTISTSQVTFSWQPGDGVTAYEIGVGTTQSSLTAKPWGDIDFQAVGLNTSVVVDNIPLNGNPIYVRLWTKISGVWSYKDYTFETLAPSGE